MNTIFSLGIILLGGLVAEKVVNRYNIPAITSYILLGIILGPHALHITGDELVGASELISNIVLGFIAFHIGENFSIESFRRIGKPVMVISILAAILPWILVTGGIYGLCGQPFYVAILFGSIAAATAPAATMLVVRQYKAKGNFTDTLLGIVAIDDAWGIMVFSISLAIAQNLYLGNFSQLAMLSVIFKAAIYILLSGLIGLIVGIAVFKASGYVKKREDMLTFTLGAVLLNTGIAISLHLSPLLSNMVLGAYLINSGKMAFRFFEPLKEVDWPLYIIFYVLAGANLDVTMLGKIGFVGLIYILMRLAGKISGAYVGGIIVGSERPVVKYMGLALIPQAGVALGLAMIAKGSFPTFGPAILTTIIATTVIYELFGPLATRYALQKSGEINRPT